MNTTNTELLDNSDKAKIAESAFNQIGNSLRPLLDSNMKDHMDAAAFILAEVRLAAHNASLMPEHSKERRAAIKADILERLWRTIITDGCDEE